MKLIFCLLIHVEGFFKLILSFLGVCGQACHITQNDKFCISLQHVKKVVSDTVDFLHVDKHERLLQIDIMILMEMFKYSQSSQNSKFTMSTISQKRS